MPGSLTLMQYALTRRTDDSKFVLLIYQILYLLHKSDVPSWVLFTSKEMKRTM